MGFHVKIRGRYCGVPASLLRSRPDLAGTGLRRSGLAALKAWALRHGNTFSAKRCDGTLSLLRRILRSAVESGGEPLKSRCGP